VVLVDKLSILPDRHGGSAPLAAPTAPADGRSQKWPWFRGIRRPGTSPPAGCRAASGYRWCIRSFPR